MKARLAAVLLLLLPLCPAPAPADISFARLAQMVDSPEELQGSFRQQKYLAELDASLDSSGLFSLRRGASIRWQIVDPVQNELLITADGLSSRQGDNELLRIDADSNPDMAIVGEITFALLSAQWQRLAQYFELSGDIDGQHWHAVLRPRDAVIGRFVERVELRGATWIQVIVLHEAGGDRTTIHLVVADE